jgi:hypothetical protein
MDVTNSAYMDVNFEFEINGNMKQDWESSLNLINGFDVEVVHPYSYAVKFIVHFEPVITIGANGEIKGKFKATYSMKQNGEIRFRYDSYEANKPMQTNNNISRDTDKMSSSSIELEASLDANAFVFPNIVIKPELKFLRVLRPLTFGTIQIGTRWDNQFKGEFYQSFVGSGEMKFSSMIYPEIGFTPKIDIGATTLYEDSYQKLYTGDYIYIMNWKVAREDAVDFDSNITLITKNGAITGEDVYIFFKTKGDYESYYYTIDKESDLKPKDYSEGILYTEPFKLEPDKDKNDGENPQKHKFKYIKVVDYSIKPDVEYQFGKVISSQEQSEVYEPCKDRYISSDEAMTWQEANEFCISHSASLPTLSYVKSHPLCWYRPRISFWSIDIKESENETDEIQHYAIISENYDDELFYQHRSITEFNYFKYYFDRHEVLCIK